MFDLEREVAKWSTAVHAERCHPEAGVAELTDHLYCEIDRGRGEGLSDEAAFRAAVARLGSAPVLTAEHAKNRSAFGAVCRVAARLAGSPVSPQHRGLLVGHSIVWAGLMIGLALLMTRTAAPPALGSLIGVFLIPLWWASEQILRTALRTSR